LKETLGCISVYFIFTVAFLAEFLEISWLSSQILWRVTQFGQTRAGVFIAREFVHLVKILLCGRDHEPESATWYEAWLLTRCTRLHAFIHDYGCAIPTVAAGQIRTRRYASAVLGIAITRVPRVRNCLPN